MLHALTLIALLPLHTNPEFSAESALPRSERILTAADELHATLAGIAPRSNNLGSEVLDAVQNGKVWLNMRYRFENASDTGFAKESYASTLRTVLGYETGSYNNFSATVEFEDVSPIIDDSYNSPTNGQGSRAPVGDPDLSEVNRVFLQYKWKDIGTFKVGRQLIKLGNERWVGNVGWRQNEQTFNGATAVMDLGHGIKGVYAFVTNINTVSGADIRTRTHIANLIRDVDGLGQVTLFGIRDHREVNGGANEPSVNTIGARISGSAEVSSAGSLLWNAEWAHQDDAAKNTVPLDAEYWLGEAGWKCENATTLVGYEQLSGSGVAGDSLQTPLGTNHSFNGWADKFLVTPAEGLIDYYVSVETEVCKANVKAAWHEFRSDAKSFDFGSEFDLSAVWSLNDNVSVGTKYANYMADQNAPLTTLTTTNKFWFWVSFVK